MTGGSIGSAREPHKSRDRCSRDRGGSDELGFEDVVAGSDT